MLIIQINVGKPIVLPVRDCEELLQARGALRPARPYWDVRLRAGRDLRMEFFRRTFGAGIFGLRSGELVAPRPRSSF